MYKWSHPSVFSRSVMSVSDLEVNQRLQVEEEKSNHRLHTSVAQHWVMEELSSMPALSQVLSPILIIGLIKPARESPWSDLLLSGWRRGDGHHWTGPRWGVTASQYGSFLFGGNRNDGWTERIRKCIISKLRKQTAGCMDGQMGTSLKKIKQHLNPTVIMANATAAFHLWRSICNLSHETLTHQLTLIKQLPPDIYLSAKGANHCSLNRDQTEVRDDLHMHRCSIHNTLVKYTDTHFGQYNYLTHSQSFTSNWKINTQKFGFISLFGICMYYLCA